jgi:hypothetical protein
VFVKRYRNAELVIPVLVSAAIPGTVGQIELHASVVPDADSLGVRVSALPKGSPG